MAKVRKDLVGTVLAVDEHNTFLPLHAGDEIPDGYFVGGHAVHKGNPNDRTPPWRQKNASATLAPAADPTTTPSTPATPDGGQDSTPIPIPPKSGAGSGVDAWRAYALDATARAGANIELPADVKRDEIIAALAEAKIPTE